MKKKHLLLLATMLPAMAWAQAVIEFEQKTHDFGTIKEEGGRVAHDFEFINRGNSPLVISKVQASCGCTTPKWTKTPIEPGQKGIISVTYNPLGRPGNFNKSITVQSNATTDRERLIIKGVVTPKPQTANRSPYSVEMGDLRLGTRKVTFDEVNKGTVKEATLHVKNLADHAMTLSFHDLPRYITTEESLSVAAGEEREITFRFDSKECPQWGPLQDKSHVVIDGRKELTNTYRIHFTANVTEDFSHLTLEQKRTAPILEIPVRTLSLGRIDRATGKEGTFLIRNAGERPLEIRRVINDNLEITLRQDHLTVRSGKRADLRLTVNADGLTAGTYKRAITLQTNDPENAYVVLAIDWEVK